MSRTGERVRSAALCALGLALASPAAAVWEVTVPRTARAPKIDGRIGPDEWRGAAVIADLTQVEPQEGAAPSEKTEVYLLVDRGHLYVALRCFDSDPAGIRGTRVTRDAVLDPDDRIELIFDTFFDHRNAYFFQIGPAGSKGDGLIGNDGNFFSKEWDGIWEGRARVTSEGWSAELAIPAKTLSLPRDGDTWGFNVRRYIKRKDEEDQWASPSRKHRLFQIASAGTLHGLAVLDQGVGLDAVPYLSFQAARQHGGGDRDLRGEPGLDLRYRLTPSLAATFTANTDFAETEVDSRVVNLTRFPVFFPEKRDFFLEDSGIFDFGGLDKGLLPFFSRRIGLSDDGREVPIRAGAKLTGRAGRWSLGLLDVATAATDGLPAKNLTVARAAVNVLAESQAGILLTLGDPQSSGDNAVAGTDFTYRTRSFLGDRNLRVDSFVLATRDRPPDDRARGGYAWGVLADYPNDFLDAFAGVREVSADFEPALGFVERRGERHLYGRIELRPRPRGGPVRYYSFSIRPDVYTSLADGRVDSGELRLTFLEVRFQSGDSLELSFTSNEERLGEPFEIHDGVVLPPDRYRFDQWDVEGTFADKRPLAGGVEISGGTFFSGTRRRYSGNLAVRPAKGLAIEAEYERNDIDLAEGRFRTNLARLRVIVDFSPRVSWTSFLQHDDDSDSLGVNSRLRVILAPGRDLFFVVNHAFETLGPDRRFALRPAATDATVKASYTLRF